MVRWSSIQCAARGLVVLVSTQRNARIHLFATGICLILGVVLRVNTQDWIALSLAMGLVWIAEGLNTALEFLADACCPEKHPLIRNAKDVAAGSVLIAALCACCVGALVFLPPMLKD